MPPPLSSSALKMQAALAVLGFDLQVVELPKSTRTAVDAAHAIGCKVGQIAKSLVFQTSHTRQPLMVIASGTNTVDLARLAHVQGEPIVKAEADFVRTHTGFAIGGVPPVGHAAPLVIYLDENLMGYDWI